MNIRLILGASTLALATLTGTAFAQEAVPAKPETPRIDGREALQQNRIQRNRADGKLTAHETKRLRTEQKVIDHQQKKYKADGVVTAKERKRMDRMQDAARKDIKHQSRDGNTAASKAAK
ncbi:MAG TPA: hypothetical protein VLA16_15280 [Ideonella sp.]|nr:hypothetical protein [Ideonella sp.]